MRLALVTALLIAGASELVAQTDAEQIARASSAGPKSVSDNATIREWESGRVLRVGTNEYQCFPNLGPSPYPACLDEIWVDWVKALFNGDDAPPRPGKVAVGYWLQGAAPGGSNEDPFASEAETESHVQVSGAAHAAVLFPLRGALEGVTTDPGLGGPWVMWKGTPYEHLMIPAPSPGN